MSANITVYMVVNLTIRDKDEYRIYEKGFFSFLKKHNGTFITYDEKTKDYFWEMTNGPLRRKVSIRSMRILNDNLEVDRILGEIEKYHKYS